MFLFLSHLGKGELHTMIISPYLVTPTLYTSFIHHYIYNKQIMLKSLYKFYYLLTQVQSL